MHQRLGEGGSKRPKENSQFVLSKRNPEAIYTDILKVFKDIFT